MQGYRDTHLPERMFTYFYRIRDRYKRDVTSLAIFTDQDEKYHPDKYEYHCCGASVTYSFNTYKVKTQRVDVLEQSDNPFAVVILTILTALKQNEEGHDHLVESFLGLIRRLLNRQLPKHKIVRLVAFIKRYVHLGNSPLFNKFEEEIKLLTENPAYMGILEQVLQIDTEEAEKRGAISGRLIGIEEGKAQIVANLLVNSDFDIQTIASLTGESIDFIIEIKNKLP
ncbi:cytoplasmic protein [Filimonas lacunae]|nr:cytoplasmic protein [Filimonas lacunae]